MNQTLQRFLIGLAVAGCAFGLGGLSAYITAESPLERSLRRDLNLVAGSDLWIEEVDVVSDPNLVVLVSRANGQFKLFGAFRHRGSPFDYEQTRWRVFGYVGSGAPAGEPEELWEYVESYEGYPSSKSIDEFWDRLNFEF